MTTAASGDGTEAAITHRPRWRGLGLLVAAAAVLSVGASVGVDITRRFVQRYEAMIASRFATMNGELTASARGDGLYLRFTNFQSDATAEFAQNLYQQAVYLMYPHKVLVGDPAAVATTPYQVLAGNFEPTDQWLLLHGVHTLLSCHIDGTRLLTYAHRVPATEPSR